jgi:hypothetical protein
VNEEDFDKLIDIIDDLRYDAFVKDSNKDYLAMLSNRTVNRIRKLCGLEEE